MHSNQAGAMRRSAPFTSSHVAPRLAAQAPCKAARCAVKANAAMKALVLNLDGAIVESASLRRAAYNAAFAHFDVQVPKKGRLVWSEEYLALLQQRAGSGASMIEWFFTQTGWPESAPDTLERQQLVQALHSYQESYYQSELSRGGLTPRTGVTRLLDEALDAGLLVGVCSAGSRAATQAALNTLLGEQRAAALHAVVTAEDVDKAKPDPAVYKAAAERLGVATNEAVVVEDSAVGCQAALGAGSRCVVTYTPATRAQAFNGAERIVQSLGDARWPEITVGELMKARVVQDDRFELTVTDSGVFFNIDVQNQYQ